MSPKALVAQSSRIGRLMGALLLTGWLAGCASKSPTRDLAKFGGAVVRLPESVPVLQAARKGIVTVLALNSSGETVGYGTGFYIQSNQVVTCLHVIDAASVLQIVGADGKRHSVPGVFAAELTVDAAVLWVTNAPPVGGILAIRTTPAVIGEKAYALGAPETLAIKQSEGEVLRVLDLGTQTLVSSLVLTVPVVPGFSGGPVLDRDGRVIGITGAISGTAKNRYSIAIPIELVEPLREPEPVSFARWRKSFPAPPFPAFVEATKGERIVTEEPKAALEHFERAIAIAPDYTRAWIQKASCLLRLGQMDPAEKAYARAAALSPALPVPRLMRALCLHKLGRLDEAQAELREVIRIQPRSAQPRLMLVSVCLELRDFQQALRAARQAVALAPNKAQGHIALGTILNRIGEPAGALGSFQTAAKLAPAGPALWGEIAALELELGQDEAAREACDQALALPDSSTARGSRYLRALVALRAHDTATATASFQQVMADEILGAKQADLPTGAIEALGVLRSRGVEDAGVHREMGGYFVRTGRMKEARAALEQAARMEPRDPRSWAGVAQLCATDWRDERAEETALHAIALNGGERFAHQSLGAAYALRGRLEEARREMETELRITGPNANTFLALAAIESRAGRPASSKSWLEKARSLDGGLVAKFEKRIGSFLPDARPIRAEAKTEN